MTENLRGLIAGVLIDTLEGNPGLVEATRLSDSVGDVEVSVDCLALADALIAALRLSEEAGIIVGCSHDDE